MDFGIYMDKTPIIYARDDGIKKIWDSVWKETTVIEYLSNLKMELVSSFLDIKGMDTLEVGCGGGEDSLALAAKGANPVCIDVSSESMNLIKTNMEKFSINGELLIADGFSLPFKDNSFDLVFNTGVIEHFKDPSGMIREMTRVCKQGGHVCIFVPQTFNLYSLKKRILMKTGRWKLGWETNYLPLSLKRAMSREGLKPVKTFGTGSFFESLRFTGRSRFGRPVIPKFILNILDGVPYDSFFRIYTGLDVGIIAKNEV
jgi:ubiquinone/menaquinone biosynthesis C-methylase UbiE